MLSSGGDCDHWGEGDESDLGSLSDSDGEVAHPGSGVGDADPSSDAPALEEPAEAALPQVFGASMPAHVEGGSASGAQPVVAARARPDLNLHFSVPGGEVRFYPKARRFAAHCHQEGHGKCRREKLAYSGALPSQGRPLGSLAAWLANDEYTCHEDHLVCANTIPLADRVAAREALKEAIGADSALFSAERPRRPHEPEEPEDCP